MEKLILGLAVSLIMSFLAQIEAFCQSKKYISQFSHFQSYFNPGLTGYEGSTLRGFVRNQWSGVEGAPSTYFISVELDFGQLKDKDNPVLAGKNAISLNMLHDTYGAFKETEMILGYASRVRINEKNHIRLGAGINLQSIRLDGNALSTIQQQDATINQYVGSFASLRIYDFNLGMALTHPNYYISFGAHNITKGRVSSGDDFMDGRPLIIMVQSGFRGHVSENLSLITNFFYADYGDLSDNMEFNVKALFYDSFWLGAGYRVEHARNVQIGFIKNKLRLGYVFENAIKSNRSILGSTHEIMVVFNFLGNTSIKPGKINLW